MSIEFKAGKYNEETERLYKKVIRILQQFDLKEEIISLKSKYEDVKGEEKISLAFVGQYSAGKSTIIKALTGNNTIRIDSDIATSEVKSYTWGNIILTDTPGLNTNEHDEHDALTIEAIKRADLLIYCITSDLFGRVTRDDFKKLAETYKTKMFLLINKMSKESGEYEELVKNYRDSINRTIAPEYSLADFDNFFIDAADYIEGQKENDIDFIEDSHFDEFIESLNKFIQLYGLIGKMLTPLSIVQENIEDILINIEDDEHVKEGKQLVQKICRVVEDKKRSYVKACNTEIQKISNKFINKGNEISLKMGDENFQFDDRDFQEFSDPLLERLHNTIVEYFEKYAQEVDNEVQKVMESELATHYFIEEKKRLDKSIEGQKDFTHAFSAIEESIGKASVNFAPRISGLFAKIANVQEGKNITIWTVKGTDLHQMVKKIGNKMGYKFKPFEALKISKKIAAASKWLGPVLTGAGTLVEVVGVIAERRGERKLEQAKDNIKIVFKGMAETTVDHYNEQVNEAAKEFDHIRDSLLKEIARIEAESENNKELKNELMSVKKEVETLQHEIEYGE